MEAQGQLLEDQRTRIEWLEKDVSKLQSRLSEANRLNNDKLKELQQTIEQTGGATAA